MFTSHTLAQCQAKLEETLLIDRLALKPEDLGISRKKFDQEAIESAYKVLTEWGNPFDYRPTLVNLCSGEEANEAVTNDLLMAESRGLTAFDEFRTERLESSNISFYAAIKKLKLKTFGSMKVKQTVNGKTKNVTIAAERSIFGRLLIIAKSRETLSMETILAYSLSPIPWALGLPDGGLVKTVKSKLLGKCK